MSCWVELVPPGSYTHICILLFPTGVRTLSYCLPCPCSFWPSSPRLFKNHDREGFPTVYGNPWLPPGFFNIYSAHINLFTCVSSLLSEVKPLKTKDRCNFFHGCHSFLNLDSYGDDNDSRENEERWGHTALEKFCLARMATET